MPRGTPIELLAERTHKEIAGRMGISRQRVQQLEKRALKKLRARSETRRLLELVAAKGRP
jgi:DNA-directed RNA polymerase sigma subunit (sigma70/sigma32)